MYSFLWYQNSSFINHSKLNYQIDNKPQHQDSSDSKGLLQIQFQHNSENKNSDLPLLHLKTNSTYSLHSSLPPCTALHSTLLLEILLFRQTLVLLTLLDCLKLPLTTFQSLMAHRTSSNCPCLHTYTSPH